MLKAKLSRKASTTCANKCVIPLAAWLPESSWNTLSCCQLDSPDLDLQHSLCAWYSLRSADWTRSLKTYSRARSRGKYFWFWCRTVARFDASAQSNDIGWWVCAFGSVAGRIATCNQCHQVLTPNWCWFCESRWLFLQSRCLSKPCQGDLIFKLPLRLPREDGPLQEAVEKLNFEWSASEFSGVFYSISRLITNQRVRLVWLIMDI